MSDKPEEFECNCMECEDTRKCQEEWKTFVPTTNVQRRMIDVVARIEERAKLARSIKKK